MFRVRIIFMPSPYREEHQQFRPPFASSPRRSSSRSSTRGRRRRPSRTRSSSARASSASSRRTTRRTRRRRRRLLVQRREERGARPRRDGRGDDGPPRPGGHGHARSSATSVRRSRSPSFSPRRIHGEKIAALGVSEPERGERRRRHPDLGQEGRRRLHHQRRPRPTSRTEPAPTSSRCWSRRTPTPEPTAAASSSCRRRPRGSASPRS